MHSPQDFMLEEAMQVFAENPLFYVLPLLDQDRYTREVIQQIPEMKKFAEEFDHVFTTIVQNEMLNGLGVPRNVQLTEADFYKKDYNKHGVSYEVGKEVDRRIKNLKKQYAKAIIGGQDTPGGILKENVTDLLQFLQQHREFIDFVLANSKKLDAAAKQWKQNLNAGELPALEEAWGYEDSSKNRKTLEQALLKENILKPLEDVYAFASSKEVDSYIEKISAEIRELNEGELHPLFVRKLNYVLQKNAQEKYHEANMGILARINESISNKKFPGEQEKRVYLNLVTPQLKQINLDINPKQYHQIVNLVLNNATYFFTHLTKKDVNKIIDGLLEASRNMLSQTQRDIIESSKDDPKLMGQISNTLKNLSLQRPDFQLEMQRTMQHAVFQFLNNKIAEHAAKVSESETAKGGKEGEK